MSRYDNDDAAMAKATLRSVTNYEKLKDMRVMGQPILMLDRTELLGAICILMQQLPYLMPTKTTVLDEYK